MIRLLIVEDDRNTLAGLTDLLRQEGYWVHGVTTGRQAVECIAAERFDMALCDYSLPGMDGLRVCQELKRAQPELMLFMITAYNTAELNRAAKECGIIRIFNKPLNLDELFNALWAASLSPLATEEGFAIP
jgi:DNA-binding response OmpR family regulator